ncbi:MAG TPA: protein kinase [Gemmatimonadales bacterium]|nr:protein kinase [Gemmatimonadales bacterium]
MIGVLGSLTDRERGGRDEAEQLYDQARSLPHGARSAFLDDACRGDVELRAELVSLLEHAEAAEEFFARLAEVVVGPSSWTTREGQESGDEGAREPAPPCPPPELPPGHTVGHYRIVARLGAGGMGTVYRAYDTRLHRDVALKFLPAHLSSAQDAEERLLVEARAAAALEHPNICGVHEIGETAEGQPFIAMACYEGETLKERLRQGPLLVAKAVGVAGQIARGLAVAHARGIIHRDVKPGNVMLTPDGTVKLLDFGLAKVADVSLTAPGLTPGTVAYMSPEQARGDSLDHRTDLWSLGVVLYEMLTGVRPFRGGNDRAVIQAILHDQPEPLRRRVGGPPESLEPIVDRLLRKEPDARYGSAAEFLTDLVHANSAPVETAPALSVDEPPSPPHGTNGLGPAVTATPLVRALRPGFLRRRRVIALALSIMGLAAVGLTIRSFTPPRLPTSPAAIAVLPFAYRGSPKFSYLREGLVDLLSTKLEGAPGLRPVDSRTLLKFASREGDITDPQRGALLARRFGAGLFVLGSVTEAHGRLGVSATIYDAGGRPRNSFEAMARGEEEIFDLADRLARQILAEAQDEPDQFARVAGQTTTSLPALKAYLEGARELRAGRPTIAEEDFRRAVQLDTSFALAYYWLAGLTGDTAMVDRALRHSDRLGEHHRALLRALAASMRGDHTGANQQYRQIVALHPDDVEAWHGLAWLTQEKGPLMGGAWVDAREPYERVLALDPGNVSALFSLSTIAAREGRLTDLDSLTARQLQLVQNYHWASIARGQRAVARGDTAGEARFVAELRKRPDAWAHEGAAIVTWTTGNLTAGRRLWGLITEPSRSVGYRVKAHVVLAKIELTNGRWNAASAELEALGALDRGAALEHRACYALTRFREAPRSELMALRDSLRRWDPSSARTEGDGLFPVHRGLHRYLRLYLLGLLSARLRDEPAARRYVAELERVDRSSPRGRFAADKAQAIRSELAWIRGRREEALTLLEGAQFWTTSSGLDGGGSEFAANFHERFARPELLYELGREDEALPWYRSFTYDLLYTGPAELRLGQIYEHKGDQRRAIEHYSRFVELWRESDPELQPMVRQAQQALARLR